MRSFVLALGAAMLLPTLAPAQTLDRIKEKGEIVIGFREDAAPLSYLSDKGPLGYAPSICFELADKIGTHLDLETLDVVFQTVDTETRFEKVASGEIDLLCGAASITLSRRELVDFSIPIYVDGTTVALRQNGPQSLPGLAGRKIGVRSGTTTLQALTNTLAAESIDAEIVQFSDHGSGMAAVEGGAVDAYFADQSILMDMVIQSGNAGNLKVLEQILTVEKQGLAMAKGDTDFRLVVDRGLSELFREGKVRQIFEQEVTGATPGLALEAMFLLSPTIQ